MKPANREEDLVVWFEPRVVRPHYGSGEINTRDVWVNGGPDGLAPQGSSHPCSSGWNIPRLRSHRLPASWRGIVKLAADLKGGTSDALFPSKVQSFLNYLIAGFLQNESSNPTTSRNRDRPTSSRGSRTRVALSSQTSSRCQVAWG
jgi:hypothetical protein